jgi:hypothetical protein
VTEVELVFLPMIKREGSERRDKRDSQEETNLWGMDSAQEIVKRVFGERKITMKQTEVRWIERSDELREKPHSLSEWESCSLRVYHN